MKNLFKIYPTQSHLIPQNPTIISSLLYIYIIRYQLLVTSLVFVCSYSLAHEPYVAPLAYKTEQTQVPVVAGYAEEALNSEYALKDAKLTVITPK
ncbi:hypothetical protein WAJ68_06055, partial [Acinetobacter baumannii]